MLFHRKSTWMIILTVVVCACLYDHAHGNRNKETPAEELTKALLSGGKKETGAIVAMDADDTNLGNPVRDLLRIVWFIIKLVTYPIRLVYRLIFTYVAVIGLLLLNCRIIPKTQCLGTIRFGHFAEDIVNTVVEELGGFLTTLNVHATS